LIGNSLFVHETDGGFSVAVDRQPLGCDSEVIGTGEGCTLDLESLKSVLMSFGEVSSVTRGEDDTNQEVGPFSCLCIRH
jgi:hypothetical protein